MKNRVVAIALSGGVDSLVSGFLLKKQYPEVFGIHFLTGYEQTPTDTALLEKQLGFKVYCVDLTETFEQLVVKYLVETYLQGKTPNPCIICNREIKFGILMDHAFKLGAGLFSTGHYATIVNSAAHPQIKVPHPYLKKGRDPKKDQSYFLSMVPANRLGKIIFPLAGMTKLQVKAFAEEHHLYPLQPGESQDICFIRPDMSVSDFILKKQGLKPQSGNIVDINGTIVGRHNGLHKFTVGQRRGINCPASQPYYVRRLNISDNQLEVCFKSDLQQKAFRVEKLNWNDSDMTKDHTVTTKIRYSHPGAKSKLYIEKNTAKVEFETSQNAVTPGQTAVFYKDDRVAGAGIIQ